MLTVPVTTSPVAEARPTAPVPASNSTKSLSDPVGAAALFAGEYRWETWRLLTPRNSRRNLLAAKFLVYGLGCAASLAALALAGLLQSFYAAMLGSAITAPAAGFASAAALTFLTSLAELLVLGAVAALAAVVSRAMIAALLAAVVFSFAQAIAMALLHPWQAPIKDFVFLPSMCAYLLRAWAAGQEMAPGIGADPAKVLPAAAILAAWIAVAGGVALALFQAQDLPRE